MSTASPRLSSTATLTILVEDANDNTPVILQPNLVLNTARVNENSPPSTMVFQAIATDGDTGNNAQIRYVAFMLAMSNLCQIQFLILM